MWYDSLQTDCPRSAAVSIFLQTTIDFFDFSFLRVSGILSLHQRVNLMLSLCNGVHVCVCARACLHTALLTIVLSSSLPSLIDFVA